MLSFPGELKGWNSHCAPSFLRSQPTLYAPSLLEALGTLSFVGACTACMVTLLVYLSFGRRMLLSVAAGTATFVAFTYAWGTP